MYLPHIRGCLLNSLNKIILFFIVNLVLLLGTVTACLASKNPEVVVSILPQKFFVEQISGDLINVTVMVPPGANPATYEPKPRQMTRLSRASLYFAIGVPFERAWLKRFKSANPNLIIVETWRGIERYPITYSRHLSHKTRKAVSLDPHIWLSPPLVLIQARNILTALCAKYPKWSETFKTNFSSFAKRIIQVDLSIMKILGTEHSVSPRPFVAFHPSWGYFARAYNLRQIAIEQEGKEPKPSQLLKLIKDIKALAVKVILIQPQFSQKSAKIIAEATGARLVEADPLALEWDENLLNVAKGIKEGWR